VHRLRRLGKWRFQLVVLLTPTCIHAYTTTSGSTPDPLDPPSTLTRLCAVPGPLHIISYLQTLMDGPTWQLLRGDEVVADLIVFGADFPVDKCTLDPKEGFEEIRPMFEEELRLLDAHDDSISVWERSYERVRSEVKLAHPDGHLVR
jgi:hypothetical protein